MRSTKNTTPLPIGKAARVAFEIEEVRGHCSKAAAEMLRLKRLNEIELEECAQLDDALAQAHRTLKQAIRTIMLERLRRGARNASKR